MLFAKKTDFFHSLSFRLAVMYMSMFLASSIIVFLITLFVLTFAMDRRDKIAHLDEAEEYASILSLRDMDFLKTALEVEAESEGIQKLFLRVIDFSGTEIFSTDRSNWNHVGIDKEAVLMIRNGKYYTPQKILIPGTQKKILVSYNLIGPGLILQIAESIEDKTTVKLHYTLAPNELQVEKGVLENYYIDTYYGKKLEMKVGDLETELLLQGEEAVYYGSTLETFFCLHPLNGVRKWVSVWFPQELREKNGITAVRSGERRILLLETSTGEVLQDVILPHRTAGLSISGGSVFTADCVDRKVYGFEIETGKQHLAYRVPPGPRDTEACGSDTAGGDSAVIATGAGSTAEKADFNFIVQDQQLYIGNYDGRILKIDRRQE